MNYEFNIITELNVEESTEPLRISGILCKLNHKSRNGRVYQLEEAEQISAYLLNKPVYYETDSRNKHRKGSFWEIGKVVKAWVDSATNSIRGPNEP